MNNMRLPKVGDAFEFDYKYRDEKTEVIGLLVVDVTPEHVMYKMTCSSYIYPMTHEIWTLNQELRRPKIGVYNE